MGIFVLPFPTFGSCFTRARRPGTCGQVVPAQGAGLRGPRAGRSLEAQDTSAWRKLDTCPLVMWAKAGSDGPARCQEAMRPVEPELGLFKESLKIRLKKNSRVLKYW